MEVEKEVVMEEAEMEVERKVEVEKVKSRRGRGGSRDRVRGVVVKCKKVDNVVEVIGRHSRGGGGGGS